VLLHTRVKEDAVSHLPFFLLKEGRKDTTTYEYSFYQKFGMDYGKRVLWRYGMESILYQQITGTCALPEPGLQYRKLHATAVPAAVHGDDEHQKEPVMQVA
jgi:hypothetical protein